MIEILYYLPESAVLLTWNSHCFSLDVIKAGRVVEIFWVVGKQHVVKVWESKLGSNVIWQGLEHNRVEDLRPFFSRFVVGTRGMAKLAQWWKMWNRTRLGSDHCYLDCVIYLLPLEWFCWCLVCVCALLVWTELDTVKRGFDDVSNIGWRSKRIFPAITLFFFSGIEIVPFPCSLSF